MLILLPPQLSLALPDHKTFSIQYCTTGCRVLSVAVFPINDIGIPFCDNGISSAKHLNCCRIWVLNCPLNNINKIKAMLILWAILPCLSFAVWLLLNVTYLVKCPNRTHYSLNVCFFCFVFFSVNPPAVLIMLICTLDQANGCLKWLLKSLWYQQIT